MTITMFDSIDVSQLPSGAGYAYAGYVGGHWPNYAEIKAKFPTSNVLSIAISASEVAECLDVENGDATISQVPTWLYGMLSAGAVRPCLYASVSQMDALIKQVQTVINVSGVRLWSAHYGQGEHICGPSTCKQMSITADGTQWTDKAMGRDLDQSVLFSNFFSATPPPPPPSSTVPTWQVDMMNSLPTIQQGATGPYVRRVQGLCLAALSGSKLAIDGIFGPNTTAAVKQAQTAAHVTVDGIVGPVTWNVLVTGSA